MQSLQRCWRILLLLLLPVLASANSEGTFEPLTILDKLLNKNAMELVYAGDALHVFRQGLSDPMNVLQSWDPSLVNPCTWFHVTCNNENSVIRVDLGNAGLAGALVSTLGSLPALQYLELYSNNISGIIPNELGKLTNLVSLDLYQNDLSGSIPITLGSLSSLRFLRLNNNSLTAHIPVQLTSLQQLQVLDLSNNQLTGKVPTNGSFSLFTATSFSNNPGLCGKVVHKRCHPLKTPPPYASPPAGNPAKSQQPPITRGDDG